MNRITKEEWIERFHLKHGDKFDYSKIKEIKSRNDKIEIICKKHNITFEQQVFVHYTGAGCGCELCNSERKQIKKYNTETFLKELPESLKKYDYDYSKVNYTGIFNKVEVICKKHGSFLISPTKLLSGHRCRKCDTEEKSEMFRSSTEDFIKKCKERFDIEYDYSKTVYGKNARDEIIIGCPNCGFVKTTPLMFYYSEIGCKCQTHQYIGETKTAKFLTRNNIVFERQKKYPDLKDKTFLSYDFYLQNYNLLIEYNGRQHYEQKAFNKTRKEFLLQKHHDWLKRKYAKKNGIKLLTIPYWEFNNIDKILKENLSGY